MNSASVRIGVPFFFAVKFLDDVDVESLLIRMLVFPDTAPTTLPPAFSMTCFSSSRDLKCDNQPVIHIVNPLSVVVLLSSIGSINVM